MKENVPEARQSLPLDYRCIRAAGLNALPPWSFYDEPFDSARFTEWQAQYRAEHGGEVWPIAHRADRMEIVAFVRKLGEETWSIAEIDIDPFDRAPIEPQTPMPFGVLQRFGSFKDWLKSALDEAFEYMDEETLQEMSDWVSSETQTQQ